VSGFAHEPPSGSGYARNTPKSSARRIVDTANHDGKDLIVDQICLVLPVKPGKTADARAFMDELENVRKADYARSEEQIGIPKEAWYIATIPSGDLLVAYMESNDFNRSLQLFSASQDEFDLWFKERLDNATGLDLNNPPPDIQLPELLSSYIAEKVKAS
jgi:hypothetical protein